jgi:hypothetical protein
VTASGAINVRVIGMILPEVEVVFAALGAVELDPHRYS